MLKTKHCIEVCSSFDSFTCPQKIKENTVHFPLNGVFVYRRCVCMFNCCHVQLFATPWTIVLQAPLSMGFPRQEYRSRLPFPPPRDLSDPRIETASPVSSALAGGFFTTEPPGKPSSNLHFFLIQSIQW